MVIGMIKRVRAIGAAFILIAIAFCVDSPKASAHYTYCNNTSYVLRSAIGYYADGQWTTRGWWTLLPGNCRIVLPQDLRHGTYYTYAESVFGHRGGIKYFAGHEAFCTTDGYFTLYGRDCSAQDAELNNFVKVQVGSQRKWRTTFTEPAEFTSEKAEIAGVQRLLMDNGYDPGNIDGELGRKTRIAIAAFKKTQGLSVSSLVSAELINALTEKANHTASEQGYDFCNKTDETLWTAIGYEQDGQMRSRGWWMLKPDVCSKVLKDTLTEETYYVYAVVDGEGNGDETVAASGDNLLCTAEVKFDIEGQEDCELRGFTLSGFMAVDTGGAPSWTQDFVLD